MDWLLALIKRGLDWFFAPLPPPPLIPMNLNPEPPKPAVEPVPPTKAEMLYELAKSLRGTRLTMNAAIPKTVGCAQAASKLFALFGIRGIPTLGISGTSDLCTFLEQSDQFREVDTLAPGFVLLYETGQGNGKIRGHVFVVGYFSLMSNNSETGLWSDHWQYEGPEGAKAFYEQYGALKPRIFEPV